MFMCIYREVVGAFPLTYCGLSISLSSSIYNVKYKKTYSWRHRIVCRLYLYRCRARFREHCSSSSSTVEVEVVVVVKSASYLCQWLRNRSRADHITKADSSRTVDIAGPRFENKTRHFSGRRLPRQVHRQKLTKYSRYIFTSSGDSLFHFHPFEMPLTTHTLF